jgi:ribosomal protein S18 acetylase RimI-like enzyme
MIEIRTLESISIEQLQQAHNKAFEDYAEPNNKTVEQLTYLLQRRGYRSELSFGAFDGDELVSFTFNGIGIWNGIPTAYDTGTGTIKAYRQQGLASRIFRESIPILKQNGITQYLLEVIKVNTAAADLYRKAGFEVSREFDYYVAIKETLIPSSHTHTIKEVTAPDWQLFQSFWDFQPSWQNAMDAIVRKQDHFKILAAYDGETIIGYGIVEPHTGDIPQLAVAPAYRRRKIATALMQALAAEINAEAIRLINADADYPAFRQLMQSVGLQPGYGQYEMTKML